MPAAKGVSIRDQLSSYGQSTGERFKGFRLGATIDTSRLSNLGCGARCCKLSLTGMTAFLVIAGIAICAGGGYASQNSDILDAIGNSFTEYILAFGVLTIFVGSLGVGGAVRESRALLSLFMCFLGCFMLAMLIFGAWILSNIGSEGTIIQRAWQAMNQDQKDHVEQAYTCCGAYYYSSATDLYTAFGVIFIVISAIMIITLVFTFCLMSGIAAAQEAKNPKKGKGKK